MSDTAAEKSYGLIRDYLGGLAAAERFAAALGAVDGTRSIDAAVRKPALAFVAATDWSSIASPASARLVGAFVEQIGRFGWQDPFDHAYATGSGLAGRACTTGRIGPNGPVPASDLAAGFFAVGPGVDYRDHRHEPEELYLPIAGRAQYWNEAAGWREAGPDTVMIHPPWQWHAMRTSEQPVLILWMWVGRSGFSDPPELRRSIGAVET